MVLYYGGVDAILVFFFKQKTAYEMRISDWSSDVCSSDLLANTARMRARAAQLGLSLRPHMKTAKSATVAILAHAGTKGPVTVSTLAEAAYFAAAGFRDILSAVPMAPQKLDQAAPIMRDHPCDLKLLTHPIPMSQSTPPP